MAAETSANLKLAVLIDADNATPSVAEALLAEVAKFGTSFVRRAYGDWTGPNLKGWKDQLLLRSIQPIQQFPYTQGKNATDSAMIIDAMDLLYTNRFDGFCLVSSDSDFTRLAARIRESGLVVYGFGEQKTPKPFVAACDKFVYFENLSVAPPDEAALAAAVQRTTLTANNASVPTGSSNRRSLPPTARIDPDIEWQLRMAIETASDEDGWANLAKVVPLITKRRPDFDPRTYGHSKFSEMVIATNAFDIVKRAPGEGKAVVVYARDKKWTRGGAS